MKLSWQQFLQTCQVLRNADESYWDYSIKNHCNDLAIIAVGKQELVIPIRYVASYLNTGNLSKGSDNHSSSYGVIIEALEAQGYEKVTRDPYQKTYEFSVYQDYYTSLTGSPDSKLASRDDKLLTFWITREANHILKAFDTYDTRGRPDGFTEARTWFVTHSATGESYPAKIIWGLATNQPGGKFTSHQAVRALRQAGFECANLSECPPQEKQVKPIYEGSEKQLTYSSRERSQVARKNCIDHYRQNIMNGRLACLVCDLDFSERYGELGRRLYPCSSPESAL